MKPANPCLIAMLWLPALLFPSCGNDDGGSGSLAPRDEAAACLDHNDAQAALEILDSLSPGERDEPWALHLRGRVLLAAAPPVREAEAEALFRAAIKKKPDASSVRIDLADLLSRGGRWVEAVKILDEGRDLDLENPRLLFQTARIYLAAAEVDGALRAVDAGLSLGSGAAEGLLLKGTILFDCTNRKEEGLDTMRRALRTDTDIRGGKENLAGALTAYAIQIEARGNPAAALSLVEEALRYFPGLQRALGERGRLLIMAGNLDAGADDLRRACAKDPVDEESRVLLARTLKTLGYGKLRSDRKGALALFRETVGLDAPGVDVTVLEKILEEAARSLGDAPLKEGGESSGLESDREKERRARELFEEGSLLLQEGKSGKAEEAFRKALELMPTNPFVHHQLGLALILAGRYGEGESALKEAVRLAEALDVALPASYVKLAELAVRQGRLGDARDLLDRHDGRFPDRARDSRVLGLRALLDG